MSRGSAPNPQADADGRGGSGPSDCSVGGDVRSALKALIVANEYLESEVGELMRAGRFKTYTG
jgi:hypothetical protein